MNNKDVPLAISRFRERLFDFALCFIISDKEILRIEWLIV